MTDTPIELPADIQHMDEDEKALAGMPHLDDRMKYHRKRLPVIQNLYGIVGVKAYRAKFPEANDVILKQSWPVAFTPKPAGYNDWLCKLVDTWFISDIALNETNRATVERLNIDMAPRSFDPDRHFSKPLSPSLLEKLANVFTEHGAHLDTGRPMSMSQVREAVKIAKAQQAEGKPFANVGHITGNQLVVGKASLRVEQHCGHDCVRLMVNGSRIRLRLDALAEFINQAGFGGSSPSILYHRYIGELALNAGTGDFLPPTDTDDEQSSGELALNDEGLADSSGELALTEPLSLTERIAALRPALSPPEPAHSPAATDDPDADPLAFS